MGPLSESELEAAVAAGSVTPRTLVWCEGMEHWAALEKVRPDLARAAGAPSGGLPGLEPVPGEGEASMVWCAECGRPRPREETMRYGDRSVCAECKPFFIQRLREGGQAAGGVEFAGFWIRGAAVFLDALIFFGGFLVLYVLVAAGLGASTTPPEDNLLFSVMLAVLFTGLEIFMLLRYGATPGKLLLGLQVVSEGGGRLSFWQACARSLWSTLLTSIPAVGTLLYVAECAHAIRDPEKRAVHDIVCRTRVIRKR